MPVAVQAPRLSNPLLSQCKLLSRDPRANHPNPTTATFAFSLPLSSAAPHQVGLAPGLCKESTHYSSEKRTTNQSYGPTYFFLHVDESTRHVLALCKALSHSHCAQSPCRDQGKRQKYTCAGCAVEEPGHDLQSALTMLSPHALIQD